MTSPDRQTVLNFLEQNPEVTSRRDIAKGLGVKGEARAALRAILKDLEADGALERTAAKRYARADQPPPTTVVEFTRIDEQGDIVGRAVGRDGPFGPELLYKGPSRKGHHRGRSRPERAPGIGDRALCDLRETREGWTAHVIKVLPKRDGEALVGLYTRTARGGRVASVNRKDKRELLIAEGDTGGAQDGDLVRVQPKADRHTHGPRRGRVEEVIGRAGDPRAASLIAIATHNIPTEFPDAALREAREAEPAPAPREDLTALPLITIDPEDARDHDDAVFAETLQDGWRVIVAIADVAAFVTEGSALDREAYRRGNSTYFADRVVPMLPFELSADACSLREGELRRCFAVEMEFDEAGTRRRHRFIRGMMRSAAKLSYNEAQAAIDGKPGGRAGEILHDVLKPLWGAYAALSQARARRGPLELDLPERRIEFSDEGEVTGVRVKERFDAHKLIEEMMIQANVAAAETLEKAHSPLVYRVHDQPGEAKLAALAEFLKTLDIKWPLGERPQTGRFNRLLQTARESDQEQVVNEIVLRTQSQAVYSPDNLGHFGLNLKKYAHFTSPIRRYADLVVHRALIRALKLGPDGLSDSAASRLEETASHITETERRSMAAERDANDRYLALFLADRVGAEFGGRITGVTRSGLFVRLAETGADGFVPVSTLSNEYWVFDEGSMALIARGSGRRFELGQTVETRLKEVAPLQGGLLLEITSRPKPKKAGEKLPAREEGGNARVRTRGKPDGGHRRGRGKAGGERNR